MGELVQDRPDVMRHYLHGWCGTDLVSALPIDAFVLSIARACHASSSTVEALQVSAPGSRANARTRASLHSTLRSRVHCRLTRPHSGCDCSGCFV
eukprot:5986316-Prymnesium_polylepis.1